RDAGAPGLLPRPFDEEADLAPVARGLAHAADGLAVGLAAPHGDRPVQADVPADDRDPERLRLRDVLDRPRRRRADDADVDPVKVVDREHTAGALGRDVLAAVQPRAREEPGERREPKPRERPRPVAVGHAALRERTSSSMRDTT